MAGKDDADLRKVAAVLIPVVVGSLLGLGTSIATSYFNFQFQQEETIRKETDARLERAMTLAVKYSSDVGKALSIGIITKGEATAKELAVLSAPSDTLAELSAVIQLYFPRLKGEVDQIYAAHAAMMQRFDSIIDARDQHRGEDVAAFSERIQKETAVAMSRVHSLRNELGRMANDRRR
ncbi:MAG TPA: hypothetical protein VLW45_04405 [Pelomicrobium sp.]|nr:hypothetical protein [Pelomicrobium sp.]